MDIQELVNQPRESLTVELKSWINPEDPAGIITLVKAAIAMRNNNGGFILIGFNNDTCQPIHDDVPENVQQLFHKDIIQGLVTRYASESFEIEVHFPEIDGHAFPVIEIGSGVRSPVGTKRDFSPIGAPHLRQNKVYVRSLSSNSTPSTTEATWKDWEPLVETCFKNREADIGGFFRRQVGGLNRELIREFAKYFARELHVAQDVRLEAQDAQHAIVADQVKVGEDAVVEIEPSESTEDILSKIMSNGMAVYHTARYRIIHRAVPGFCVILIDLMLRLSEWICLLHWSVPYPPAFGRSVSVQSLILNNTSVCRATCISDS